MQSHYTAAVEAITCKLQDVRGSISARCEQVRQLSLEDLPQHIDLFEVLAAYTWFDGYLCSEKRFVERSVADFRSQFHVLFELSSGKCLSTLRKFLKDPSQQSEGGRKVPTLLSHVQRLAALGKVCPEVSSAHEEFDRISAEIVEGWCAVQRERLGTLPDALDCIKDISAKPLDEALLVCEALSSATVAPEALRDLASEAKAKLAHYSRMVQNLIEQEEEYAAKALVMDAIALWTEQGLLFVVEALPSLDRIRALVREQICVKTRQIRKMISESVVTPAHTLDHHINGFAKHEAESIKELLELRQGQMSFNLRSKLASLDRFRSTQT